MVEKQRAQRVPGRAILPLPPKKEPASCAVFGTIAYGEGGHVWVNQALRGIGAVPYRGGEMGNGIALAHPRGEGVSRSRFHRMQAWVDGPATLDQIKNTLPSTEVVLKTEWTPMDPSAKEGKGLWQAEMDAPDLDLLRQVIAVNGSLTPAQGRIVSFMKHLLLVKDLANLTELATRNGIVDLLARALIAHTRFPTGSGTLPVRAHPYAFGNVAIAHNGDVASYLANLDACDEILCRLLYPVFDTSPEFEADDLLAQFRPLIWKSWVGTDSEVIAAALYLLLREGLSIPTAFSMLLPRSDNYAATLEPGTEREQLRTLRERYSGIALDGPVTVTALVVDNNDVQLVAARDSQDLRPLEVLIDRRAQQAYVGSELVQLEAASGVRASDPQVESYSLEPGRLFLASANHGILESGRLNRPFIQIPSPATDGKTVIESSGEPHLLAGDMEDHHYLILGTAGNGAGSFAGRKRNEPDGRPGPGGLFEYASSVQHMLHEAFTGRGVIVHGNVGFKFGDAFQGDFSYVRGTADTRAFQQLRRAFRWDVPASQCPPSVALIGERAGSYTFKMIAGGVGMVLDIDNLGKEVDSPVGPLTATGMMDGRIYVRGKVPRIHIGKLPSARLMAAQIRQLRREDRIGAVEEQALFRRSLDDAYIAEVLADVPEARARLLVNFYDKGQRRFRIEHRELDTSDLAVVGPHIDSFCRIFQLGTDVRDQLLQSGYTVVDLHPVQTNGISNGHA